jgi:hypothetical protein
MKKNSQQFDMLFDAQGSINSNDFKKIIRASVFMADTIWMPETLIVNPSETEESRKFIRRRIQELYEIGAIKLYGIEGIDSKSYRGIKTILGNRKPDITIGKEEFEVMYNDVFNRIVDRRKKLFGDRNNSYDGVTEIVMGKQEMFRFSIGNKLNTTRYLVGENSSRNLDHFFTDLLKYEDFEGQILNEVIKALDLPDVSLLSSVDIEDCRKLMPKFRENFDVKTKRPTNNVFMDDIIKDISIEIVNEYMDKLEKNSKTLNSPVHNTGEEIFWDLIQLMFPPSVVAKYLYKLFGHKIPSGSSPDPLLYNLRSKK